MLVYYEASGDVQAAIQRKANQRMAAEEENRFN
jgi:hypothetical protein